jgi:hypothetical protein
VTGAPERHHQGTRLTDSTTDLTPNIPEVVAEVRGLFERYEQALADKDVAVRDATFWDSPHTIRYAMRENGYGVAAIHAHRVASPPGAGINRRHCAKLLEALAGYQKV